MFKFECPSCHASFKGDERHVNKQVKCPKCGHRFVVPPQGEMSGSRPSVLASSDPLASRRPTIASAVDGATGGPPPLPHNRGMAQAEPLSPSPQSSRLPLLLVIGGIAAVVLLSAISVGAYLVLRTSAEPSPAQIASSSPSGGAEAAVDSATSTSDGVDHSVPTQSEPQIDVAISEVVDITRDPDWSDHHAVVLWCLAKTESAMPDQPDAQRRVRLAMMPLQTMVGRMDEYQANVAKTIPLVDARASTLAKSKPRAALEPWLELAEAAVRAGDSDTRTVAVDHAMQLLERLPPEELQTARLEVAQTLYEICNYVRSRGLAGEVVKAIAGNPKDFPPEFVAQAVVMSTGRKEETKEWLKTISNSDRDRILDAAARSRLQANDPSNAKLLASFMREGKPREVLTWLIMDQLIDVGSSIGFGGAGDVHLFHDGLLYNGSPYWQATVRRSAMLGTLVENPDDDTFKIAEAMGAEFYLLQLPTYLKSGRLDHVEAKIRSTKDDVYKARALATLAVAWHRLGDANRFESILKSIPAKGIEGTDQQAYANAVRLVRADAYLAVGDIVKARDQEASVTDPGLELRPLWLMVRAQVGAGALHVDRDDMWHGQAMERVLAQMALDLPDHKVGWALVRDDKTLRIPLAYLELLTAAGEAKLACELVGELSAQGQAQAWPVIAIGVVGPRPLKNIDYPEYEMPEAEAKRMSAIDRILRDPRARFRRAEGLPIYTPQRAAVREVGQPVQLAANTPTVNPARPQRPAVGSVPRTIARPQQPAASAIFGNEFSDDVQGWMQALDSKDQSIRAKGMLKIEKGTDAKYKHQPTGLAAGKLVLIASDLDDPLQPRAVKWLYDCSDHIWDGFDEQNEGMRLAALAPLLEPGVHPIIRAKWFEVIKRHTFNCRTIRGLYAEMCLRMLGDPQLHEVVMRNGFDYSLLPPQVLADKPFSVQARLRDLPTADDNQFKRVILARVAMQALPLAVADVPLIFPLLSDKDPNIRSDAMVAVQSCLRSAGADAVRNDLALRTSIETALNAALKDSDVATRRTAADTLGFLSKGTPPGRGHFAPQGSNAPDLSDLSANELSRIAHSPGQSDRTHVAVCAAVRDQTFSNRDTANVLLEIRVHYLFSKDEQLRRMACKDMGWSGPLPANLRKRIEQAQRQETCEDIRDDLPFAADPFHAVQGYPLMTDAKPSEATLAAMQSVLADRSSKPYDVRCAIMGLMPPKHLADSRTVALVGAYLKHETLWLRWAAAEYCEQAGPAARSLLPSLMKVAEDDVFDLARIAALSALLKIDPQLKQIRPLTKKLSTDPCEQVRILALFGPVSSGSAADVGPYVDAIWLRNGAHRDTLGARTAPKPGMPQLKEVIKTWTKEQIAQITVPDALAKDLMSPRQERRSEAANFCIVVGPAASALGPLLHDLQRYDPNSFREGLFKAIGE